MAFSPSPRNVAHPPTEAPSTPTLDQVDALLTRQSQSGELIFGGQGRRGITNDIFFGLAEEGKQLKTVVRTLSAERSRQQRQVEELQSRVSDSERLATSLQQRIANLQQQTPPVDPAERLRDQQRLRELRGELEAERARTNAVRQGPSRPVSAQRKAVHAGPCYYAL